MCGICGCSGNTEELKKTTLTHSASHDHHHHEHDHDHHHSHHHHEHSADEATNVVQLEQQILARNNHLADHNREDYAAQNIATFNLVSSPGSGKTTLLEKTLKRLIPDTPCAVIEGDQQTSHDADRIAATGAPVIQINTGTGCHLEADMTRKAAKTLELKNDSFLFIENVGNLVCPALFDLGERAKVAILSVTEGADKPLKYPHMFNASRLMIINKIDLLPYVEFDVEQCIAYARQVNPAIEVIQLSATKGDGMDTWLNWLGAQLTVNS